MRESDTKVWGIMCVTDEEEVFFLLSVDAMIPPRGCMDLKIHHWNVISKLPLINGILDRI